MVAIGEWGIYCVYCRRWLTPQETLPLRGHRRVKPTDKVRPGEAVGRCPLHQAKGQAAYCVQRV